MVSLLKMTDIYPNHYAIIRGRAVLRARKAGTVDLGKGRHRLTRAHIEHSQSVRYFDGCGQLVSREIDGDDGPMPAWMLYPGAPNEVVIAAIPTNSPLLGVVGVTGQLF